MITLRSSLDRIEKGLKDNTMTLEDVKKAIFDLDNDLYDIENDLATASEMAMLLSERAGADDRELTKDTIDKLTMSHETTKALFNVLLDYLLRTKAAFNA